MNYNDIILINQDIKPDNIQENNMYVVSPRQEKGVDTDTSDLNTDSLPNPLTTRQRFETLVYDQKRHKYSLQLSLKSYNNSMSSMPCFTNFRLSNSVMNLSTMMTNKQKKIHEDLSDRSSEYKATYEEDKKSIASLSIPDIRGVIQCLQSDDTEVQFNAAAYLQHITYRNEENKELVKNMDGIPALVSMLSSQSSTCQFNSASVLRNLSHGSNLQIKLQIQQCGIMEIIECLLENSHQLERRFTEAIMAILCNLSCAESFHVPIVKSSLERVIQCVLLPLLGLKINIKTGRILDFNFTDLSFSYNSLLEYITSFLKNLSSGGQYIRQELRHCEGLVDSVLAIIQHSSKNGHINSIIVENCACFVRNLCYALQEIVDPDYLTKKSVANNAATKYGKKMNHDTPNSVGSRSSKELLLSSRSTRLDSSNSKNSIKSGVVLLWDDDIIDILLFIINECCNYSTIESAIGAVQNLAACDWHLAEDFRFNFRKKKGLPSLVIQLNNGPDKVIKVAIGALRNLAQDNRNLDLIGKHCLYHLIRLLPSQANPVVKRIVVSGSEDDGPELPEEYLGLDTIYSVLSLIYFIIKTCPVFCQEFVEMNGVKNCMFLLKSDNFYKDHLQNTHPKQSENGDKIPVLTANILQMLWSIQEFGPYFKKEKFTCEDFCVQTIASELKSTLSCSKKNTPKVTSVYYGKPYMKARNNALLPWTIRLNQRQPTVLVTNDNPNEYDKSPPPQNSERPSFFVNNSDKDLSKPANVQRGYENNGYLKDPNKSHSKREVDPSSMSAQKDNQRRRKIVQEF